jgi:hypothetical protein
MLKGAVRMESPTSMKEYLDVIARSRAALESVIEGRSHAEMTELRDAGGWAVKDHLYHLAAWERGMTYLLTGRPRHEGMGIDERSWVDLDEDAVNDVIFRQSKDLPLAVVTSDFHAAHREMIELLGSMSFEELHKPYSHFDPDMTGENRNQPVFYWLFGNTVGHFDMHREWIEVIMRGSDESRS